jgi:hypothetical protein
VETGLEFDRRRLIPTDVARGVLFRVQVSSERVRVIPVLFDFAELG